MSSFRKFTASEFDQANSNIDSSSFENDVERRKALQQARSLCRRLERPMDTMIRIAWMECVTAPTMKIALDMGLFQALGQDLSASFSVTQLSASTGADAALLSRLLRLLASKDIVKELDAEAYAPTKFSVAMQDRSINSAVDFRLMIQKRFDTLPEFLNKTNYQNPTSSKDGPWQFATSNNSTFFQHLLNHPPELEIMTSHMSGYTRERETWDTIYPIHSELLSSPSEIDLILVDVGGGIGQDLQRFSQNFSIDPSRLHLQDLPSVLSHAPSKIPKTPLDFFNQCPVSGARAYYLHSILHDWPDREAITILRNLKPALRTREDGYKPELLLNENVLSTKTRLKEQTAAQDWFMLMLCGSHERTRERWGDLLPEAGYRMTGVFESEHVDEAVVEAELVGS